MAEEIDKYILLALQTTYGPSFFKGVNRGNQMTYYVHSRP